MLSSPTNAPTSRRGSTSGPASDPICVLRGSSPRRWTVEVRLIEAPPFRVREDAADRPLVEEVFAGYRASLPEERRYLLDRYSLVDFIRQVVGVGSVGMRVYLVALQGSRPDDVLLLQFKQAGPAVYESFLGASRYPNHGQRVTVGRRFIQSATDILVGWTSAGSIDFYVRTFRDMKVVPSGDQIAPWLRPFATSAVGSSPEPTPPPATPQRSTPTSAKAAASPTSHPIRDRLRPTEHHRPHPTR